MSEPLRTDPPNAAPGSEADREARIEQLLLSGLDHYFAGKYEQAINIWTRVAFLERGHGRARAYIERARGALAERQRESEELLHIGVEAYHAGDLQSAHALLTRAVDEGGDNDTALMFLQRLGRLEAAAPALSAEAVNRTFPPHASRAGGRAAETKWVATAVASILVAAAILLSALPVASWLAELPVAAPAVEPARVEPLPVVRGAEMRVSRARALYTAGRLHDALRILDEVDVADPVRPDADRLKADVQRDLLAAVRTTVTAPAAEAAPR